MGFRKVVAQTASAVSTATLRYVFRRPAGNFPGKMALIIDPAIIAEAASKLVYGSICVVGTNGKTTVTNMLADCLEAAGRRIVCNRTGANLDSGVATSLLHAREADWGIFECDELWLVKILPHLKSRYVLLLNLFPDQIDRVGSVDYIQESIAEALQQSPETTLIYNADDPHCEKIARMVENPRIPFGIAEALDMHEGSAACTQICQACDAMLNYDYRSYSQLGAFECPSCDFKRAPLQFMAKNCTIGLEGMAFDILAATDARAVAGGLIAHMEAPYTGTYMVYNLLAVFIAAHRVGLSNNVVQLSAKSFDQHNGRLEHMRVHGRSVLLNLAKNPTGFNQNLGIALQEKGPVAIGFFVNDMEGDGHDVSWLWDVDFESLAQRPQTVVYAGGMRANDVAVRLKYAGVPSIVVEDATDLMQRASTLDAAYKVFLIANYTSLPIVREACVKMAAETVAPVATQAQLQQPKALPNVQVEGEALHILHLYPQLLDQGGDAGNVRILEKRCTWRGIPVHVTKVERGEIPDFATADIVVLGDGFDRQQRLACESLLAHKDAFISYVETGGVVLAIDGGLQILGSTWYIDEKEFDGIGILAMKNGRAEGEDGRIVGEIAVQTPLVPTPVIGFENHEGTTLLGEDVQPFGMALKGVGNNTGDATEGILYKNLVGTYVHGPVLAKCPQLADWLIARSLRQKGDNRLLKELDDSAENAARAYMCKRLGLS